VVNQSDQDQPRETHAGRRTLRCPRAWLVLLITVIAALCADLATKSVAFASIGPDPVTLDRELTADLVARDPTSLQLAIPEDARRSVVTVVPSVLEFKLVLNPGAVFGSGPGKRWFFVTFTLVAIAFCVFVFIKLTSAGDWLTHIALGLIAGGGLGNLYDRLVFACVRDFIHPLPGVRFPFGITIFGRTEVWPYVSNLADALLLIGIGYLVVKLWRGDEPDTPTHETQDAKPPTTPAT